MKFGCCTKDEGGPFRLGIQVLSLNHYALLSLRGWVVNSIEKANINLSGER